MVSLADIHEFKSEMLRKDAIEARVSSHMTVGHEPLDFVPCLRLNFVVGGGVFLEQDHKIQFGPDDGKIVTLLPWFPARSLARIPEYYNGTPEEAEAAYGYSARPAIIYAGRLHISTLMYLRGLMKAKTEADMLIELNRMYCEFHSISKT
jgi:hypothetical protein